MPAFRSSKKRKRFVLYFLGFFILVFLALFFFANRFVVPALRDRLHTLIVQGSDSLYQYRLGSLKANFFGGNVEVEELQIWVDSNRYYRLDALNALPSLTMQLNLQKGRIHGLGVFSLIFGKQIKVEEIQSKEADIKLSRHLHKKDTVQRSLPLWKAIRPAIKEILIDRINLQGIKLLYKNADTGNSLKLQFDRCVALFENVRIDSAAAADTSRIGFTKNISLQFSGLKFRTPDSTYKMKADAITYSSKKRFLEINRFKLQPTLKKEAFFREAAFQKSRYEVLFEKVLFTNLRLDLFINDNIISADSALVEQPALSIYVDRTLPPIFRNRLGTYPHQELLNAGSIIRVKGVRISDAMISYTEKNGKTFQEGALQFSGLNALLSNITNDSSLIRHQSECLAVVHANIFETCPVEARFSFQLASQDGDFQVTGGLGRLEAKQLNTVAEPLGRVNIRSLHIDSLRFQVQGDDYSASGRVQMRYRHLSLVLEKADAQTGQIKTKKFLTKIINKFSIYPENPGPDGRERVAENVVYARVASKSFFGVIWKTVFAGMQNIMMKSGTYD